MAAAVHKLVPVQNPLSVAPSDGALVARGVTRPGRPDQWNLDRPASTRRGRRRRALEPPRAERPYPALGLARSCP